MIRFILSILFCATALPACGQYSLPDDSKKCHIIVVTEKSPGAMSQRLLGWFENDASLKRLKTSCHFHHFDVENPLYRERYAPSLSTTIPTKLPILVIARHDGGVIYKTTSLPWTAQSLHAEIKSVFAFAKEQCPDCQPQPSPTPDYDDPVDRPWFRPIPDSSDVLPNQNILTGGAYLVGGLIVLMAIAGALIVELIVISLVMRMFK